MKVLVTGANGFIGSHLHEYLTSNGHEVLRSLRSHDGQPNTFALDSTTPHSRLVEAMTGVGCIIHLAAVAHVTSQMDSTIEELYQSVNVDFTRRLADAAVIAGVKRFVFISSIKVSGEESGQQALSEVDGHALSDPYSKSKQSAEQSLRRIEMQSGLEVVIVRPPLVYGPRVRANFGLLLSAIRAGVPLPFKGLQNKRSLIYVKNLVSALALCATRPELAGGTFAVSDSPPISLDELASEISLAMQKVPRTFILPKKVLLILGVISRKRQQISSMTKSLEVDSSKFRKIAHWKPSYDLKKSIAETVEWYLNEKSPLSHVDLIQSQDEDRRLKVCQLCAVDFTLFHLLRPLIDGMKARGWDVTSVCSDGKYATKLSAQGYRLHTISVSRNLFDVIAHLGAIWKIFNLCRKEKFDVLHVHTPIAALLGRIAGRLAGVPLIVYTAHGFYFHDQMPRLQYRFYVLLERLSKRLTDFLFTQSQEDAQTAIVERIADELGVLCIGNGVSTDVFTPDPAERVRARFSLGLSKEDFVIGVIARLVREKGLVEFLRAALEVGSRFPQAKFILVGERLLSDHNASVERELREAQDMLGSRLIVTGYRDDVPLLLGAMDLFCLPSYREGMPRSIIEAMMMSLPVVSTDIRGAREEVVPGQTGLLVPARDANALVRAFTTFIVDPNLGVQMGREGRNRALELYDEKKVIARQMEVFSALLAKKGRFQA